jgi:hypothetical protein
MNRRRLLVAAVLLVAVSGCTGAPPVATVPPPLATPTPNPSTAQRSVAMEAIAHLGEKAKDPKRSFRVDQESHVTLASFQLEATSRVDVAGEDFSAQGKIHGEGLGTARYGAVAVGSRMWARVDKQPWKRQRADQRLGIDIVEVFGPITEARHLAFVKTEKLGSQEVLHLRNIEPIPYRIDRLYPDTVTGSITNLDVYVREDGTPVRIDYTSSAQYPALHVRITTDNVLRFSRWGQKVTIKAPA